MFPNPIQAATIDDSAGAVGGIITPLMGGRHFAIARDGTLHVNGFGNNNWTTWGGWGSGMPLSQAKFVTPMVNGTMFAIASDDSLYRQSVGSEYFGYWEPAGGGLPQASAKLVTPVYAGQAFAIGMDDKVYTNDTNGTLAGWFGFDTGLPGGQAKYVTPVVDDHTFAIGSDDQIYVRWKGAGWGSWALWNNGLPSGTAKFVTTLSNGHVLAIGSDDKIYQTSSAAWGTWTLFDSGLPGGAAKYVTPFLNGYIFAIGVDDKVYARSSGAGWASWSLWSNGLPGGTARAITPLLNGHLFAVGSDQLVYVMWSGNWGTWTVMSAGFPGGPSKVWPYLDRKAGAFNIGTPAGQGTRDIEIAEAAAMGLTLNMTDRASDTTQPHPPQFLDAMRQHGMRYIDRHIWTNIIYPRCGGLPCVIDASEQLQIVDLTTQYVTGRANDDLIAAYQISDDYQDAYILPTLAAVARIVHENATNLPARPTVCSFYAPLDYKTSLQQSSWNVKDAPHPGNFYFRQFENFSAQACDFVMLYSYGEGPLVSASAYDWSMARLFPAYAGYLKSHGWDPSATPLIGMPQGWGGGPGPSAGSVYTLPTAAALRTQISGFCKSGVRTILPFIWSNLPPYTVIKTSFEIQSGLAQGLAECRSQGAIDPGGLGSVEINPKIALLNPGQSYSFTVTVRDRFGNPYNTPVTWSSSAGVIGTMSGSFTAPLQQSQITVTASAGGLSDSAQVSILGDGLGASGALSNVRVGPVPCRVNSGDLGVTFRQLPAGARVQIYTVDGQLVRSYASAVGDLFWDLRNAKSERVSSGLYLYMIESGGNKRNGKLVIIQ